MSYSLKYVSVILNVQNKLYKIAKYFFTRWLNPFGVYSKCYAWLSWLHCATDCFV